MPEDKVYVRMIDGTETLVPVNARCIDRQMFEILDDDEYADPDPSVLFEFYPGDIVEVDDVEDLDLDYQYAAKKLIKASACHDRDYLQFKFLATLRFLPINEANAEYYKYVLDRIKKESAAGAFFYRGIRETVEYLERTVKPA